MKVLTTIESLGIDGDVRGNELIAACPAHKERTGRPDNDPSWSINLDKGMHHCLGGETLVGTKNGRVPIRDLDGQKVDLLTSDGWVASTVRDFGTQRLWDIVLQRNGVRKTIRATPGHRWFVRLKGPDPYRVERTTRDLLPGQTLVSATPDPVELSMDPDAIRRGFIFGDGTRNKKTGKSFVKVHTDHKKDAVEGLFPDGTYGYPLESVLCPLSSRARTICTGGWRATLPPMVVWIRTVCLRFLVRPGRTWSSSRMSVGGWGWSPIPWSLRYVMQLSLAGRSTPTTNSSRSPWGGGRSPLTSTC